MGKGREWKKGITKGHGETFGDEGYFQYLYHGHSFTSIQTIKIKYKK